MHSDGAAKRGTGDGSAEAAWTDTGKREGTRKPTGTQVVTNQSEVKRGQIQESLINSSDCTTHVFHNQIVQKCMYFFTIDAVS